MLETKQLTVAIDFHATFAIVLKLNWYCQLFGYQHIFICVSQPKKNLVESE